MILLQTSYNNLTKERDQLHSYINQTKERHQTSYSQLAREKDQLQERFETLIKVRNDLQTKLEGNLSI